MDGVASSSAQGSSKIISSDASSGLVINLHPLPILNISEHHTRSRLTYPEGSKLIGALLGTQSNRDVSIVNSFELIYSTSDSVGNESIDVEMTEQTQASSSASPMNGTDVNMDFLATRKEQFKQVFPTLDIVGWYTVGDAPTAADIALHRQFLSSMETPLFLLFDPTPRQEARDVPIQIYEGAFGENADTQLEDRFIKLDYSIETGEAERIAVDGVARESMGDGEESSVGNLTTQRNAIRMLYERITVLLEYVTAVAENRAKPDHAILRQISSLVAGLPTMDAPDFKEELMTEYSDVQLTKYLTSLTSQLNALSEYADKHTVLHPANTGSGETFGGPGGQSSKGKSRSLMLDPFEKQTNSSRSRRQRAF